MGRRELGIERVLAEFLEREAPAEPLAVAYSGGPDSTALLGALCAIRPASGGRAPIAIYVDHGIRGEEERAAELALVERCSARLGARLAVARIRPGAVAARAAESGEGLEAEARRFRYAALGTCMRRRGAKSLLLAHTRDDQLETVLMRLLGGSGAGGLQGMPAASGAFLRPLLGSYKSELLAYADSRSLEYSTDSTNASPDFLRNRIRLELAPLLDARFPGWRRGLERASAKAALDDSALSLAAGRLGLSRAEGRGPALEAEPGALAAAPEAVALRALVAAAGELLGRSRFPHSAAAAALEALRRGVAYRGAGLELSLGADGRAMMRPLRVEARNGLDFPGRDGYFVFIDRPRRVRVGKLEVLAEWRAASRGGGEVPGIRAGAFRFPLVVRSRRPGDAIALRLGSKRLDELFSEWGMPDGARGAAPVVEDRDGIVAVLAGALGGRDRYREPPSPSGAGRAHLVVIVKGA